MGPGMGLGWDCGWCLHGARDGMGVGMEQVQEWVGVKIGWGLSGKRIGTRLEWGQEQRGSGARVGVLLSPYLGPPTLLGSPWGVVFPPAKGAGNPS